LGLFNVRTTTQVVRDRFELLLLRDRLGNRSDGLPRLRFATFQFPEDGAPLSWKMNARNRCDRDPFSRLRSTQKSIASGEGR
jgi:hypothetical protein